LKYIGGEIWREREVGDKIMGIFEEEADRIAYSDVMVVVGILVVSGVKDRRVMDLIRKLLERKKRLESLRIYGTEELEDDYRKKGK
jgi:hypothetical protein